MPPSKLQAWLATARIANVPSVISNVWLGVALGAYMHGWVSSTQLLIHGAVLALSGVMLYIGGNFLNDWHDQEWDEKHRPERALPSGVFTPLSYKLRAIRFTGLGVIIACLISVPCMIVALVIAVLIVIYTLWHKKAVWPVIPMGLCRALLPVMGFLSVAYQGSVPALAKDAGFISTHAAGLFFWIVGLSLTARYESIPNPPPTQKAIARALLFLPLIIMSAYWVRAYPLQTAIGMLPFLAWTIPLLVRRHSVPVLVSGFLAGIPLVEWIASFPLALSMLPPGDNLTAHPILMNTVVLPALAFMGGRRLQKVASAT